MKKADNAMPFYLEIDFKVYHAALQKNSVLNNMSNVDHLYVYNLWYFSSLMPVQFMIIAAYINFSRKLHTAVRNIRRVKTEDP